jgi:hypothetical protein
MPSDNTFKSLGGNYKESYGSKDYKMSDREDRKKREREAEAKLRRLKYKGVDDLFPNLKDEMKRKKPSWIKKWRNVKGMEKAFK